MERTGSESILVEFSKDQIDPGEFIAASLHFERLAVRQLGTESNNYMFLIYYSDVRDLLYFGMNCNIPKPI